MDRLLPAVQLHLSDEAVGAGEKPGGVYLPYTGLLRRVDEAAGLLLFRDGTSVPLRDIYDMYGEVFPDAL